MENQRVDIEQQNPGGEKKEFLQRLMVAKCDKGSMDYQYLNQPKDHGVYFRDLDHSLLNALDHKGEEHILQFGRCTAESNPKNIVGDVLSDVIPIFKLAGMAKHAMGCDGCKCVPKTLKVWDKTNEGNCLDGADGILNTSTIQCFYGGTITITKETDKDGQQDAEGESEDAKKSLEEHMPSAVADSISDMNAEGQSQGLGAEGGAGSSGTGSSAAGSGAFGSGTLDSSGGASGGGKSYDMNADALQADTADWYENAQDFSQNYGVSPVLMNQNYAMNMCQSIAPEALNSYGCISDVGMLQNFCMGGNSLAVLGASCAATFNLLHTLGMDTSLGDIIYGAEKQQTIKGFMDQGPVAVSMLSANKFLKKKGCQTKMMSLGSLQKKKSQLDDSVMMLGTSRKGMTSFCTMTSERNGNLTCREDVSLDMDAVLKSAPTDTTMVLAVKKRKKK